MQLDTNWHWNCYGFRKKQLKIRASLILRNRKWLQKQLRWSAAWRKKKVLWINFCWLGGDRFWSFFTLLFLLTDVCFMQMWHVQCCFCHSIQCWHVCSVENCTAAGWGVKTRADWIQGESRPDSTGAHFHIQALFIKTKICKVYMYIWPNYYRLSTG